MTMFIDEIRPLLNQQELKTIAFSAVKTERHVYRRGALLDTKVK